MTQPVMRSERTVTVSVDATIQVTVGQVVKDEYRETTVRILVGSSEVRIPTEDWLAVSRAVDEASYAFEAKWPKEVA